MNEKKQCGQEVCCSLKGSSLCPKPQECDGMNRLCSVWQVHSGK